MEVSDHSAAYEAGKAAGQMIVWVLVIGGGLGGLVFFIVALVKAVNRKTRGWIISAVIAGVVMLAGFAGTLGLAVNALTKAAKSEGERKRRIASKDGRLHLQIPSSWREMPELNGDAQLAAGNALREQYVVVIENPKSDYQGTLEEFDELVTGLLEDSLENEEIPAAADAPVGGFPAKRRRIIGTTDNLRIVYQQASVETADAYYQILAWTMPSRESAAAPVLGEVIDSLTVTGGVAAPAAPKVRKGSTHDRVATLAAELFGIEPAAVKPDARFVEDLGADSLDAVELVMAVEEEFDVEIADEAASRMKTVADLVAWLDTREKVEK